MIYEIDAKNYALPIKDVILNCPKMVKYVNNGKFDLGNSKALIQYNRCIYFLLDQLDVTIPDGHLIPTAGIRRAIVSTIIQKCNPKKVIEIGTGATAIIALLMAKNGINVVTTEINFESTKFAKSNINKNNLQKQISLYKSSGGLLKWLESYRNIFPVDMVISLPPYYSKGSIDPPRHKGFSGTNHELFSPKSANEFSINIIKETIALKKRIKYLSLLWKNKSHCNTGVLFLKENHINTRVYHIIAGNRRRYLTISNFIN